MNHDIETSITNGYGNLRLRFNSRQTTRTLNEQESRMYTCYYDFHTRAIMNPSREPPETESHARLSSASHATDRHWRQGQIYEYEREYPIYRSEMNFKYMRIR